MWSEQNRWNRPNIVEATTGQGPPPPCYITICTTRQKKSDGHARLKGLKPELRWTVVTGPFSLFLSPRFLFYSLTFLFAFYFYPPNSSSLSFSIFYYSSISISILFNSSTGLLSSMCANENEQQLCWLRRIIHTHTSTHTRPCGNGSLSVTVDVIVARQS